MSVNNTTDNKDSGSTDDENENADADAGTGRLTPLPDDEDAYEHLAQSIKKAMNRMRETKGETGFGAVMERDDTIDEFINESARAVHAGADEYAFKRHARELANPSYVPTTYTDLKELFDDALGELNDPENEDSRPFAEQVGTWGIQTADGWRQWTSFTIRPTSFLRTSDGEVHVRATVIPATASNESSYQVTVPMTVFNEPKDFRESVCKGRTTTFDATRRELNKIRAWVGRGAGNDVPEREGVEHIGLFAPDECAEFVTPAGTLGARGWGDDPEREYIRQGIGLEAKWSINEDTDTEDAREDVREIVETLSYTRDADRFLPVVGWFYATPLAPLIHDWEGEFPLLNVTGDTEAGKSATLRVLTKLFGLDGTPFDAEKESEFTLTRTLAGSNATPVWLDEYKPNNWSDRKRNQLHNLLRAVTRRSTVQRGNADKTTDDYLLQAPVVVSGEQRIQGPAEQRRCLMTTFRRETTDDDTDTARAYKRLVGESHFDADGGYVRPDAPDLSAHALAYYLFVLETIETTDDAELRDRWDTAAERVASILADDAAGLDGRGTKIGELARQGLQTVVFGIDLYRAFAASEYVEADPDALPTAADVDSAVLYAAREHVTDADVSHVDVFLGTLTNGVRRGYVKKDKHFTVVNDGRSAPTEVRFNMDSTYDMVKKYLGDHYQDDVELLSKNDLKKRLKEEHDREEGFVSAYSHPTDNLGRCIGIDLRRANAAIPEFNPDPFRDPPRTAPTPKIDFGPEQRG